MFQAISLFALLTIIVGVLPFAIAVMYAVRPTERRLALLRPVSLASIFAALAGTLGGFVSILRGIGATGTFSGEIFARVSVGLAEALVPVFLGFGWLTAAWLLVAVGMWRAER
jgi:hypothetical protein